MWKWTIQVNYLRSCETEMRLTLNCEENKTCEMWKCGENWTVPAWWTLTVWPLGRLTWIGVIG